MGTGWTIAPDIGSGTDARFPSHRASRDSRHRLTTAGAAVREVFPQSTTLRAGPCALGLHYLVALRNTDRELDIPLRPSTCCFSISSDLRQEAGVRGGFSCGGGTDAARGKRGLLLHRACGSRTLRTLRLRSSTSPRWMNASTVGASRADRLSSPTGQDCIDRVGPRLLGSARLRHRLSSSRVWRSSCASTGDRRSDGFQTSQVSQASDDHNRHSTPSPRSPH